ncbi:SHOCT domain-containing protein [Streptomyces sp. 7R007]
MFWNDHDVSGWGWFAMSAGMILFWAAIITIGVLLFRILTRPDGTPAVPRPAPRPEDLLAERFARGEIDEDEYHHRMAALRAEREQGPSLSKG